MKWIKIKTKAPKLFDEFLLEWDGTWVKACLFKRDKVSIEWLKTDNVLDISTIKEKYWLPIPPVPSFNERISQKH